MKREAFVALIAILFHPRKLLLSHSYYCNSKKDVVDDRKNGKGSQKNYVLTKKSYLKEKTICLECISLKSL